jgi:tetratricopeptide (TPR) repeat protein
MDDDPPIRDEAPAKKRRRRSRRQKAIGLGAAVAAVSALLGVAANLSEIAGLFAPDETHDLVQETRVAIQDTDAKVNELLVLLRNQAAAAGLDLNVESQTAIRDAIGAILISGNVEKQRAVKYLDEGEVGQAAALMATLAANQASAVSETSSVAADSWREAGALYYGLDVNEAVRSYEEANRLQPGDADTLRLLGKALVRAGRLNDAQSAFLECLELSPPPAINASVQLGRAGIARQRGNYALANEYLSLALATADSNGLAREEVLALIALAGVAREQGETELAARHLQQGLAISEDIPDDDLRAQILANLGILAARSEQYEEARRLTREALDIFGDVRNLAGQSMAIGNLGAIALLVGDADEAELHLRQSVEIGEQLGWQSSIAYDLVNLGGIAKERKDFATADEYLARAGNIAETVGLAELLPVIIANRGEVAFDRGDVELACRRWAEAMPLLAEMGSAHAADVADMVARAECPQNASP